MVVYKKTLTGLALKRNLQPNLDISFSLTFTLQHSGCSSFISQLSLRKNVSGQSAMSVSIAPLHGKYFCSFSPLAVTQYFFHLN